MLMPFSYITTKIEYIKGWCKIKTDITMCHSTIQWLCNLFWQMSYYDQTNYTFCFLFSLLNLHSKKIDTFKVQLWRIWSVTKDSMKAHHILYKLIRQQEVKLKCKKPPKCWQSNLYKRSHVNLFNRGQFQLITSLETVRVQAQKHPQAQKMPFKCSECHHPQVSQEKWSPLSKLYYGKD